MTGGGVRIQASPLSNSASCPRCDVSSRRVHSRYERTLADAAIGNQPSLLVLQVRRFICANIDCSRATFVEQVEGLTSRYERRTLLLLLRKIVEKIALALAGRAGSRLASALGIYVGRSTLLRLVRALPDPPTTTVEVLGVDDFALRRRHRYGTVLIDMDTHRPVDVLGDRRADTVAEWLRAHPGTEVICRDRAGAYAEAARAGAPDAIEVADRWHLWHNLAESVEKTVAAHHYCLKKEPESAPEPTIERTASEQLKRVAEQVHTTRQEGSILAIRTKNRFQAVATLKNEGMGIRTVARQLGLARETVRRFYYANSVEELLGAPRAGWPTMLDEFAEYLHERFNDGHASAAALYEELRALGYRGSYSSVRDYLRPFHRIGAAAPSRPKVPKVRRITSWILRHPDSLTDDEQIRLKQVLTSCPHLEAAAGYVTSFAEMLTERLGTQLNSWMSAVSADDLPHLHRFVRGLDTDHAAVLNGLTLPYSSGAVEGHVNRIKMLKRQMYGRAGFDLLRKRILLSD
ncbi:ISL3 family transposase [Rhodococcus erythropolis]|uniref:ISL3 family transposase n=1 Tax=Rhodococcus erythropolis TaxID=1833 RepID=UPI00294A1D33|nr:ISL3 family transposase [Rhodococcus erythropolis]MDV6278327.1 ISL3 family transposase [Rhodococcus erythropolis]